MAHSIPDQVQLVGKFNKIIRVGKTRPRGADFKASRDRSTYINIDGQILDKPIQVYRMWYRYLQLALELEDLDVSIVSRMKSVELKKPKKDAWGKLRYSEMKPVKHKVKVNRQAYDDWDINIIPRTTFNDWWKGNLKKEIRSHKELFYPDTSVEFIKTKNEWLNARWQDNSTYIYAKIDNRRRVNDIVSDFRMQLMKTQRSVESVSNFQVNGNPNINTLINRYNALILQLTTTMRDKEMLASNVFRPTKYGMSEDSTEGAYQYSGSEGRAMRDLILPSKQTLLSVCDGYFVKNPNKDYL